MTLVIIAASYALGLAAFHFHPHRRLWRDVR